MIAIIGIAKPKKKGIDGRLVDFDSVYRSFINPAVGNADMEPVRADEETLNGIIHKPLYERLILCDYAVADLTTQMRMYYMNLVSGTP